MSETEEKLSSQKQQDKFGTRHFQVLLMAASMMVGSAINQSLPLAIIAMTDASSAKSNFKYYEWTAAETSLVLSSYLWGYAIFQIPSGYLANVWSARKLFSIGLFVSSVMNILLPFMTEQGEWIALCSGRVVIGLCHSSFSSCTHTLLSKWAPPIERSRMSSFVTTGTVLGSVFAMSISGLVAASNLGWPGIFYFFGSTGVALSIILFFNVTDCPKSHKRISSLEKEFILNNFQQIKNHCEVDVSIQTPLNGSGFFWNVLNQIVLSLNNLGCFGCSSLKKFYKNPLPSCKKNPPWISIFTSVPVWALIITECGSNWGSMTLSAEMPIYMKSILNYNIASNGLVSTLPYLANWLLSFPFSWISDYALQKNVSVSKIRRCANTVGMWGSSLALVGLCFVGREDRIWSIILLILAIGIKAGTASGYIVNLIDLSPNFAGTIYSITTCLGTSISTLAPIVCGTIIRDSTDINQWHIVFYMTAFIYFVSNLIFIIFGKGKIRSWNNPIKQKPINVIYDPKTISANP